MAGAMAGALRRSSSIAAAAVCNVLDSSAVILIRTEEVPGREVRPREDEALGVGRVVENGGGGPPREGSSVGGSSPSTKRDATVLASRLELRYPPRSMLYNQRLGGTISAWVEK